MFMEATWVCLQVSAWIFLLFYFYLFFIELYILSSLTFLPPLSPSTLPPTPHAPNLLRKSCLFLLLM